MLTAISAFRGKAERGMALQWAPALIERHVRYSTRHLVSAQTHLRALNDSIVLSVARPEGFVSYCDALLHIGKLVITMGCINSRDGYELQFSSGEEYLITIPLRGSGWASTGDMFIEYGEDDIMIVAPSCKVRKHWDGPSEVISIHVPAPQFDAAAVRLGIWPNQTGPITTVGRPRLHAFLGVIDLICRDLQNAPGPSSLLREPSVSHVEDLLLTLLLQNLGEGATLPVHEASLGAVPYYVRRAEDFISGNAHRDIGVEDVASAAGVSLRSIQYGFRKYRETTPMLFLKRVRYERARALLLNATGRRRKISDIAAEIGCANISQFSRDYRSIFGESPSQTIAAPRLLVA